MSVKSLDNSLLPWLLNQWFKEILNKSLNKEEKLTELIELKRHLNDLDIKIKIAFKSGKKEDEIISFDGNPVGKFFYQLYELIENCKTLEQYNQLNENLQILHAAIEDEIYKIQNNGQSELKLKDSLDSNPYPFIYKRERLLIFIQLMKRQNILVDNNTKIGLVFECLTPFKANQISKLLSTNFEYSNVDPDDLDKIENDLYEMIDNVRKMKIKPS